MTHAATDVSKDERKRVVDSVLGTKDTDEVFDALLLRGVRDITVVEEVGNPRSFRCRLITRMTTATTNVETDPHHRRDDAVYEAAYRVLYLQQKLPTPTLGEELRAKVDALIKHALESVYVGEVYDDILRLIDRVAVPSGRTVEKLRDAVRAFDLQPEKGYHPTTGNRLRDAAKRLLDELSPDAKEVTT